jgi:outer membrane protein insertion porin family
VKKYAISVALCAALSAHAFNVKDIKYEGLGRISSSVADEMVGFSKGDRFDYDKIGKSILDFYAQGYFDDIWVEEKDGVIIYHFKEKPVIAKIEFAGLSDSERDKMMNELGFKKGDTYDEEKIEKSKKAIVKKIQEDATFGTVVEVDKKEMGEGAVELTYLINNGESIYIDKLYTIGVNKLKRNKILSQAANKEKEWMGWMWGRNDGKLRIEELEYDASRIKDIYMQYGYLDATVSKPLLKADFNSYSAELWYSVFEGEPYTVKSVKVEQKEKVIDDAELYAQLKVTPTSIFNIDKMRKDLDKLKNKIADLGYAFVKVLPDFVKDEKTHTTEVVYTTDPGQKVYINDVLISGNIRTLDSVVRREVYLAPGDLYNLSDMQDSKNSLKRTGYFEDATIDEKRISADKMDLIVKLKEAPTGNIMIGGGYGSYDGLMLNAGINDKNVFGSGLALGFNLDLSAKQTNYDISLFNPRLYDSKYSLGGDVFARKNIAYDYTQNTTGLSVTSGKQIGRHLGASTSYQYSTLKYSEIASSVTYTDDLKNTTKSSITPSLNFDNTDDFYVPRNGISAGTSLEFAGAGGQEKFVKSFSKFGYFQSLEELTSMDIILRYKARLGIFISSSSVSRGEKFYMGGMGTVRGYQSSSIGTKDINNNYLGDTKTASNSLEFSFPMVPEAKMRLLTFMDYGVVGTAKINENARSSYGAGIEWLSPVGPIQIYYSKPVNAKEGDKTSNIDFSIGSRF